MADGIQRLLFCGTPSIEDVISSEAYAALRGDHAKLVNRSAEGDSEGVVTSARTLLETCCKTILNQLSIGYGNSDDLPLLHKKVSSALELHPDQHANESLKQVMRGCNGVVNGLASLRNSHSDSHGKGPDHIPLSDCQAQFAAHMSTALVKLLVYSYEEKVHRKGYRDLSAEEVETLRSIFCEVAKELGVTDPDQMIFKPAFEDIALAFTRETGLLMSRHDIYKSLTNLRKTKRLWPPKA